MDIPADQQPKTRIVPVGIEAVTLSRPCPGCQSVVGYYDTRMDKYFCGKCGRTVRS